MFRFQKKMFRFREKQGKNLQSPPQRPQRNHIDAIGTPVAHPCTGNDIQRSWRIHFLRIHTSLKLLQIQ